MGEEVPGWFVAVTVADRDAIAARAEQLGGTVLSPVETGWTATACCATRSAQCSLPASSPPTDDCR
ncbi:MAG: hypothetical protein ACRCXL_02045 [Dermatophilaceae bacterium]